MTPSSVQIDHRSLLDFPYGMDVVVVLDIVVVVVDGLEVPALQVVTQPGSQFAAGAC